MSAWHAPLLASILVFSQGVAPAHADGPIGPDGAEISTSDYSIDLFRGPVIGTARMIGLGGAFAAIAEGVEGGLQNPAAVAHRQARWPGWYDYWLAIGLTYPFNAGDFYNSGNALGTEETITNENFVFFIPGFSLQLWNFGVGLTIDTQVTKVRVSRPDGTSTPFQIGFPTYHVQAGYGFLDNQFIVGGGIRILQQRVKLGELATDGRRVSYKTVGVGGEVGVMARPNGKRWRLGASLYPKLKTRFTRRGSADLQPDGDLVVGEFFLPRRAVDPTRGSIGFSWQFGPRPPNPRWTEVEEFAGDDLVRIDARIASVRARRDTEIAAAGHRRTPEQVSRVQEIEDRYERNLQRLKTARKNLKYAAWKILRERVRNEWPRRYVLLTTELLIAGRVNDGVGIESFVAQRVQRSGRQVSFSPRIGVEGEPWKKRMKLRGGLYLEPSRFAASNSRVHVTVGFDLRVLSWSVFGLWPEDYQWDIKVAFDASRGYNALSFGIGGWY